MTSKVSDFYHQPVLLAETLAALAVRPDGLYLDVTAGGGGHSAAIYARLGQGGHLIASDRDPEAVAETGKRLAAIQARATFEVRQRRFRELAETEEEWGRVDGLLADLGVSSHQLDSAERGVSYHLDGPLDMRMDQTATQTAADLVNTLDVAALTRLLREYGEERYAARIAAAIVQARKRRPFTHTRELADLVVRVMPAASRRESGHPARRTFQALRIAVNDELGELTSLLDVIPRLMAQRGRVAILSFHSLEDRLVKRRFVEWQNPCTCPKDLPCQCDKKPFGHVLEKRGFVAGAEERLKNPRARSARLRAFQWHGGSINGV